MDRTSRFQNLPMPLNAGSFNKPPPLPNDGVGMKPLPPLILDRFKAMMKEREDELRVFAGGALNTDEIVRLYEIVLSELTINSKPIITDLTIIAGEQRAHGEGIADAICARIVEVSVDLKLPSLYLLDSIVKNIGKDYIKYFSARLPEVFCEAYAQVHPNMHQAMRHLFGTWSAVFPLPVLQKIEAQLNLTPSINGQSSLLSSSRAPESPRPTHGIHINPKYLEAQRQFGHSTVDTFGTEGVSSTGRAGPSLDTVRKSLPSAARITRSSSPYRIGHAGSLSPSLLEFNMDSSPNKVAIRASPSHPGIDYGLSKVIGGEEEASEWRKRNWQGNSNQQIKASAAYKYNSDLDLRGPRALISAYGIDEREKKVNHKHQTAEQLDSNGAGEKVSIRTWQNTDEEEFDWEDMTPPLADSRQPNDIFQSRPPPGNVAARHVTPNHAALATDYRGNLSNSQFSSVTNSSRIEDVSRITDGRGSINNIAGVHPNVAGPSDFAREPFILLHQRSQSHFNAPGGGSFSESRIAGDQNPSLIGNFPNSDGEFGGASNVVSTLSSTYASPAPEIQPVDAAALTKSWQPANYQNSHILPSLSSFPPQMQFRGQFGMRNAGNVANQIHSDQYLASTRSMSQVTLPRFPNHRPGLVPVNLQNTAQPSLAHPNMLMAQEARQYLPLTSSAPNPSNAMLPPPNYRYLAQGQGPPLGTTSSNLTQGMQSSSSILSAPNMSFPVPGPTFQPLPRGPLPCTTQALPIGQSFGDIAPKPPAGGALSGLINSLVAQGLISITKQDSVRVEFDQDILKVRNESTITALYGDLPRQCTSCGLRFKSQEEHSKHMDWHVNKNRNLRNRKAKPSPKWFVSATMWLSGTDSLGTEAVPGFFPAENTMEKEEDEEMAVPADEDQNACALCGEPFDDFYSDEMEEWMYKGAVHMYASGGSTVGMDRLQLGPIVHAKCRSEDIKKDEGELAEEGSQRKKLRS